MPRIPYKALLRTIVGQTVYVTVFDLGDYWEDIFGKKYDKNTGEDGDGFGVLEVETVRMMSKECW